MAIWIPTENDITQNGHFWVSWVIVVTARYWNFSAKTAILAAVAWATVKEFVFDLIVENDTLRGSLIDFVWYGVGTLVAISVLELPKHFGGRKNYGRN